MAFFSVDAAKAPSLILIHQLIEERMFPLRITVFYPQIGWHLVPITPNSQLKMWPFTIKALFPQVPGLGQSSSHFLSC